MKPHITLTPVAIEHIKLIISRHSNAVAFRLSVKKTGCSGYMYAPSVVQDGQPNDICFDVDESLQVFIDSRYLNILQNLTIDFVEKTLGVKQLAYDNPNVDSTCGCGESFSLKQDDKDA